MGKIDKVEKQKRVQVIVQVLNRFGDLPEIRNVADSLGWNVGERQLSRYRRDARAIYDKAAQRNHRQTFGRHLKQLESQC